MEDLIRTGKSVLVVEEFERLKKIRIPRDWVERFSLLSYRVGMPEFGLRLLNPLIRAEGKASSTASESEKGEYAHGLIRVGASEEALEILEKQAPAVYAKTNYYRAFAYISQWDYAASIPYFEKFIADPRAEEYERLVAQVNLASAYVYELQSEGADTLLREILATAKRDHHQLVLGKALQLTAENFLNQKNWEAFDSALEDAEKLFQLTTGREKFFVRKLLLQKELEINSNSKLVEKRWNAFRREASEIRHFESVRDCDRLLALKKSDSPLLFRVYFGTPHASYRKRLLQDFKSKVEIPADFEWHLSESTAKYRVDLSSSSFGKGKFAFDRGSHPHKLLAALCRDFYAPQRIATLHHQVYPDEFFNPLSSPARVHRLIHRLRDWMNSSKLPLAVEETKEFYSLRPIAPVSIKIHSANSGTGFETDAIYQLMQRYPDKPFSVTQASTDLNIPARTLSRQIKKLMEEGKMNRIGSGPRVQYVFVASKKAA